MTLKRTPKRGETRRWRWCIAGLTSIGWRFIGIKVGHANRMNGQARSTACGGVWRESARLRPPPLWRRPTTVEVILVEVKSGTAPNTNSAFEVGRRGFNMLAFENTSRFSRALSMLVDASSSSQATTSTTACMVATRFT